MRLGIVAAFALAATAVPAFAAPVITFNGNTGGEAASATVFQNFDGLASGTSIGSNAFAYGASNSSASKPLNSNGNFGAVQAGGSYGVSFGATDVFSFVLGSLDTFNTLRLTFDDGTFTDYAGGAIINGAPFASGDRTSTSSNGLVTYRVATGPLITGATFNSSTNSFEFDNLAAGVSQAVPEPATWGMMILGFGAIGGAMRRRKERNALAVA